MLLALQMCFLSCAVCWFLCLCMFQWIHFSSLEKVNKTFNKKYYKSSNVFLVGVFYLNAVKYKTTGFPDIWIVRFLTNLKVIQEIGKSRDARTVIPSQWYLNFCANFCFKFQAIVFQLSLCSFFKTNSAIILLIDLWW